jgi:hypothetical protein
MGTLVTGPRRVEVDDGDTQARVQALCFAGKELCNPRLAKPSFPFAKRMFAVLIWARRKASPSLLSFDFDALLFSP